MMFSVVQKREPVCFLFQALKVKLPLRKDSPPRAPDQPSRDCFHLEMGRRKKKEGHGKHGVFVFLCMWDVVLPGL